MPLTCSVGLTRKIGQPDYSSLGASCSVEFELDSMILQTDLDVFQRQVRSAYVSCAQAVNNELLRQQDFSAVTGDGRSENSVTRSRNGSGNGSHHNAHAASDKQLDYARQLARQIDGLGARQLDEFADKMFGKPIVALTTLDASGLIDTLKAINEGKIDLAAVMDGASA